MDFTLKNTPSVIFSSKAIGYEVFLLIVFVFYVNHPVYTARISAR